MIKYSNFEQKYEDELITLWNKSMDFDQIDLPTFMHKAILDENFSCEMCYIALDEDKLIGFIMSTKRVVPYLEVGMEEKRGWINVMFVDPEYQDQGIGSKLYSLVEDKLRSLGVEEITLAAYFENYFFGGLDEEHYPKAKDFFLHRGYVAGGKEFSMAKDLKNFELPEQIKEKKIKFEEQGYRFAKFKNENALELLDFIKAEMPRWALSALQKMQNDTAEDILVLVFDPNNKICGYSMSAMDGNPRRFGPILIGEKYRDLGLGSVLLNYSFECMSKRGIESVFFMMTDEPGKRYYLRNGLSVIRTIVDYRKKL